VSLGLTAGAAVLTRTLRFPGWGQALAQVVLSHRLVLAPEAVDVTGERIVADALAATPAL